MNLGRIGVYLGAFSLLPAAAERDVARELEELGYGALWVGEGVGTRESFTHAATLLAWTRQTVVATGISSIYARDPMAMANGAKTLSDAFPQRFLLGLGVSHAPSVAERGHVYTPPIETMHSYLDAMDAAIYKLDEPAQPAPIVLAALAPSMLCIAHRRANGAHTYLAPPEHTAVARRILGPGLYLAPELAILMETDMKRARELGRKHTTYYLRFDAYRKNLLRLGFDQDDFEGGGSDRLVDAVVAWGDEAAICERVRAHLDAGADHVCVQSIGRSPLEELRQLARPLSEL